MKRSLPTESERQQARHFHNTADNKSSVSQAFVDNRHTTTIQQQLMAAMVNSPQSTAQRMLSQQIHTSSRMLAQRKLMSGISGEMVQRIEEDELTQAKFKPIQRTEEEDELVQTKSKSVQQQKPNNTGLPDNLKGGIEHLSGMSMDSVTVHYNSPKPTQLNALAYAQGADIHLGAGQEKHLPHEAWHVVQQAQGRVQPTMQMEEGTAINDDQGLEQEADVMGEKATRFT